ncbi:hypothetical protein LY78DRAFT_363203 [Colletotrichum sublineola]|nr:hypothetical protein LY78DRAFT_363203 [Colletotrichum sublineola]
MCKTTKLFLGLPCLGRPASPSHTVLIVLVLVDSSSYKGSCFELWGLSLFPLPSVPPFSAASASLRGLVITIRQPATLRTPKLVAKWPETGSNTPWCRPQSPLPPCHFIAHHRSGAGAMPRHLANHEWDEESSPRTHSTTKTHKKYIAQSTCLIPNGAGSFSIQSFEGIVPLVLTWGKKIA